MSSDSKRPVADDLAYTCNLGTNCLMYLADGGPRRVNVATEEEPHVILRTDAWLQHYARIMIVDFDGDFDRVLRARDDCARRLARLGYPGDREVVPTWRNRLAAAVRLRFSSDLQGWRQSYRCAIRICDVAAETLTNAGAPTDDLARQRLIAAARYPRPML